MRLVAFIRPSVCLSVCPSVSPSVSALTPELRAKRSHYQSKVFFFVSNGLADVVDRHLLYNIIDNRLTAAFMMSGNTDTTWASVLNIRAFSI